MTVRVALAVKLHAKPGKEAEVAAFLKSGLALANQESATTGWFALRSAPRPSASSTRFPTTRGGART